MAARISPAIALALLAPGICSAAGAWPIRSLKRAILALPSSAVISPAPMAARISPAIALALLAPGICWTPASAWG
ncbi:uncharacterized protein METZ01_LOCUS371991 [marine metagenome]|uniref:Uncharacterized protein n=1 Tax=marine metagenome TaxID=408172 RepID=A0A382TCD2_9ZZZZ